MTTERSAGQNLRHVLARLYNGTPHKLSERQRNWRDEKQTCTKNRETERWWVGLAFMCPGWKTLVCVCVGVYTYYISLYMRVYANKCRRVYACVYAACAWTLQHQALVRGPLGLRRLPLQTQVLQCVVEVLVDLLRLLAGLQVGQVLADLLDQLVQDLNGHLGDT